MQALLLSAYSAGSHLYWQDALQRMLREPGIPPGAPLDSDLFPVVWRAPA